MYGVYLPTLTINTSHKKRDHPKHPENQKSFLWRDAEKAITISTGKKSVFFSGRAIHPPKYYIHSRKRTWNLKITCLKRKFIFQTSIFGFHVSFGGVDAVPRYQKWWLKRMYLLSTMAFFGEAYIHENPFSVKPIPLGQKKPKVCACRA